VSAVRSYTSQEALLRFVDKTKVFRMQIRMANVEAAIRRAKPPEPKGPILEELGTEVYRIIEHLVESKTISIIEN